MIKQRWLQVLGLFALACAGPALAQPSTDSSASVYNPNVRPDPAGDPTDVALEVLVLDLVSIDDVEQEFTADLVINGRWRDARLATGEPEGDERTLPLAEVWNPVVGVLNRRSVSALLPEQVRVDGEGKVVYSQRVLGQFASRLDLRRFPADEQKLEVQFASYRYGPDEVAIEVDSGRTGRLEELSVAGWQIGQPELDPDPLDVPGGKRSGVTLRLGATRETTYYVLTMALPLVLIGLMAWTVFWIDPSLLPSQIGVSTASVFSLIAFRLSLNTQLPRVSYLTSADWFILSMTLLVFGALGAAVLTGRLAKGDRIELARRIDTIGRWIYFTALVAVCTLPFV